MYAVKAKIRKIQVYLILLAQVFSAARAVCPRVVSQQSSDSERAAIESSASFLPRSNFHIVVIIKASCTNVQKHAGFAGIPLQVGQYNKPEFCQTLWKAFQAIHLEGNRGKSHAHMSRCRSYSFILE